MDPSPPVSTPATSSPATSSSTVDSSSFTYTSRYCEENVYMLCKKLIETESANPKGTDLFVVFISNDRKKVPLWCQKAGTNVGGLVLWDYHVICIQSIRTLDGDHNHLVWDPDSMLPCPSALDQYLEEAIRPYVSLSPAFRRLFRVIHAPIFLKLFASDRRHMKDPLGNWISPPPPYEPIISEDGSTHNLDEYMQISVADEMMDRKTAIEEVFWKKLGVVVDETQLKDLIVEIASYK